MKTHKPLFTFVFFFLSIGLFSQTPNEDYAKAEMAVSAENWEKSIELLQKGIKDYKTDTRFHILLANIYYEKELYELSYKYFKEALKINKYNTSLYFSLSEVSAQLNKDQEALDYVTKYLEKNPSDLYAIATYGWLCFKVHESERGIKKLENAMHTYGETGSMYSTLATLYSEIYDYKNSKKYYDKALVYAKKNNSTYSAAIYYYNRAILEASFYNFDSAYKDAKSAIKADDRASIKSVLFNLEFRQNNFQEALNLARNAITTDTTQIMKMNLIKLYIETGHWNQAESLIQAVKNNTNHTWISNYGLSVLQHKAELCSYESDLYLYKYYEEKSRIKTGILDGLKSAKKQIKYYSKYKYADNLYKVYLTRIAKEFKKPTSNKSIDVAYDAYINFFYYEIFEHDAYKALKYLEKAEKIETSFIPEIKHLYSVKKGILLKDRKILNEGIQNLNYDWEKPDLVIALANASLLTNKNETELQHSYLYKLFELNPASFYHHNIYLPVEITVHSTNSKFSNKKILSYLKHSRFQKTKKSLFKLSITLNNNNIQFSLKAEDAKLISSGAFKLAKNDKNSIIDACNKFVKQTFTVRLR